MAIWLSPLSCQRLYALSILTVMLGLQASVAHGQLLFKNGFEPFEGACFNGADDDADGLPDCADSDCNSKVRTNFFYPEAGIGKPAAFRSFYSEQEYLAAPFSSTIKGWNITSPTEVPIGSVISGGLVTDLVFIDTVDGTYLLFSSPDGHIKSLNAANWTAYQSRNLRRGACLSDEPAKRPVLQLRAESNAAFQSQFETDLVFVGTRHGCGDNTQNQVIALKALDLATDPLWVFNSGEFEVDVVENCILDISSNTLFCGTNLQNGLFQNTIWAINTLDGSPRWAANVGALHSAPVLVEQTVAPHSVT